jgi:hypothetical protein
VRVLSWVRKEGRVVSRRVEMDVSRVESSSGVAVWEGSCG